MSKTGELDVVVVGGAGHVGLPLCLVLADAGLVVGLIDRNRDALETIQRGELPFQERDASPVLERVLREERLHCIEQTAGLADLDEPPIVIVTIGTPIDEFLNPDTSVLRDWADEALQWLRDDQLVVLRSTVAPGTTEWLQRYFLDRGRRVELAFCPERIAQGEAIRELQELPQIVSGTSAGAEQRAADLFERIAPEILRMPPREAEFAKLFTNAYRYINFAIANQFYTLATAEGLDYDRIQHACRHDYPRMAGMPRPGFTAGPCLFKDTMQLVATSENRFVLGNAAMLVNEGLPAFLVRQAEERGALAGRTVGILGMAFKAGIDDARASLSYKLKKLLRMQVDRVLCTDPYVSDPRLVSLEQVLEEADTIFVGTPHPEYRELEVPEGKFVFDVWNCVATTPSAVAAEADPADVGRVTAPH